MRNNLQQMFANEGQLPEGMAGTVGTVDRTAVIRCAPRAVRPQHRLCQAAPAPAPAPTAAHATRFRMPLALPTHGVCRAKQLIHALRHVPRPLCAPIRPTGGRPARRAQYPDPPPPQARPPEGGAGARPARRAQCVG